MSKLPSGYTKLAYIQSTGTQYVDTGIKPNQNTRVLMDARLDQGGVCYLYGCRGDDAANYNNRFGIMHNGTLFRSDFGAGNGPTFPSTVRTSVRYQMDKNKQTCTIGSTSIVNTDASFQSDLPMYLCCVREGADAKYFASITLYACKIYDNGSLVRDFQPCIDTNGNVGLFDFVEWKFYGNSGTGVFSTGPEIAQPPAAPGNFRQTAKDYFSMSLAWDCVSDAAGYKLYRDGTLLATLSETGYTDTGLQPNTAYTYTVAGINAEGEGDPATLTAKTKEGFAVEPNLITDRTQEDVLSLLSAIARIESGTGTAEDASLIKQTGNKGAYNFTDLNRVGAAVSYISRIITGTGYASAVSPKTDWMESDKPTEAQLNQYLADVETLRNGMVGILNSYAAESAYPLPEVPTDMLGLTYQEANDIETILLHIYKQIRYMSDHMYWVHSNDVYSGEV